MKRDEVIKLATQFVQQAAGPNPQLKGEPYEYRFIGARPLTSDEWSVIFNVQMLGSPPSIIDGPVVVNVDLKSGDVKFL